jgi:hypothetical protein
MSYRGLIVPLPVGQQGFTGTENPSQAGPGHLLYTDGVELEAGILRKEGGASKFNASTLDSGAVIISGINWTPTGSNRRDVVFTSGGKVLKDTGAGTFGTTMVSGLTSVREPPPWFSVGGGEAVGSARKLFLFSSANQVQVASGDGATMAAISNPAADWTGAGNFPTFGLVHGFRNWGGGNNSDPHRLYYSTISNHEDFTSVGSGSIAIYPGEGEILAGAFSFRGALVVWKYPQGVYIVNTSDPSPANWSVTPLTRAVGTLNQHSIIPIENDILYMDVAGGIHALSTTQEFGDLFTSDIGDIERIRTFMKRYANIAKLRRVQGLWYGRRKQAWWAVPLLGSDDNNLRFVTLIEAPPAGSQSSQPIRRFFMSRRDICVSMWTKPDAESVPTPVVGDTSGFVWLLDNTVRSKNGAGYSFTFETANTDFGFYDQTLATKMKAGQFLEINYEPRGDWDLTVEVFWDDTLTDILSFNMGSGGASLGSFILDTDVLSSSVVRSARIKMDGSGRRLRLVADNSGAGEDINLASFFVHMAMMDERISE